MPMLGLGTWPMLGGEARAAVAAALDAGYRLLDTSEQYDNEAPVGQAVRESGIPREDVFVTSKLNARWHGEKLVAEALERSLERLGLEYVDLYLIHWPNPWVDRYVEAWRGMVGLRNAGLVRAIGVSNFSEAHIDRLIAETGVAPESNQIELDPTLPRAERRAYHEAHGIVTSTWSPLGRNGALLAEPIVTAIAERHGRSPAQVVLRWHVQHGLIPVARSSDPARIAENIAVFDFELDADDLAALRELDRGREPARDSETHGH